MFHYECTLQWVVPNLFLGANQLMSLVNVQTNNKANTITEMASILHPRIADEGWVTLFER